MIDVRLAIPAAVAWTSLVVTLTRPDVLPLVAATAGCAAGVSLGVGALIALRSPSGRGELRGFSSLLAVIALSLALVSLVTAVAVVQLPSRVPVPLASAASRGSPLDITAVATAPADAARGQLPITLTSVTPVGGPMIAASAPTYVTGATFAGRVPDSGDTVHFRGSLSQAPPGGSLVFFARPDGDVTVTTPATGAAGWAAALRAGFRTTSEALPGDGGALLPGLSIGDTSRVPEPLDVALKASGLSHLTAVSGANCAVVVALVLLVGGAVRLRRALRILLAVGALIGFVVLVTPEPSVLRAAVMAGIVLVLHAVGRPVHGLPVVSLAVVVLLVSDPWNARDYGFALSVLATTGLVLLVAPITRLLTRILPEPLALLIAVPLSAQLACQPLLLTLDPGIPVHSVVANLLAEPAAPVATILGLTSCLIGVVWPGGARIIAGAAWVPSAWIAAVAHFASGLPVTSVPWRADPAGLGLACLLVVLVAAVVLTMPFRRSRRIAVVALLAVAVPVTSVVTGREVGRIIAFPTSWQYVQCDVGQGDAVLVRSERTVALIDTGDDPRLLEACLDLAGVGTLDLLVLTHFDRDHVGAAAGLAGRARRLLVGPIGEASDERLVETFQGAGSEVTVAAPGAMFGLGKLDLAVLWPPVGQESGNEASVVLRVTPRAGCVDGCLSGVLLGDLGEREQQRLLGRGDPGPVDIVKVSHHGSRDQSAALYDALSARIALIGVGRDNQYGHPTSETLALLARTGSRVERSDLDGTVALAEGRDGSIEVWSGGERLSAAAPRLDGVRPTTRAAGGGSWLARRLPRRRRPSTRCRGIASGQHP
ncbi:MAG: competence protein ComEC [Frondihabitans sp.]|nr:competence protein ComEC [Frondihabitans sp.]